MSNQHDPHPTTWAGVSWRLFERFGSLALVAALFIFMYFNPNNEGQLRADLLAERAASKGEYEALRKENEELRERWYRLREEVSTLRSQMTFLQSADEELPFPAWLKDRNGLVLRVNKAYEDKYLIPRGYTRSDYVGGTDKDVWPKSVADKFKAHDLRVVREGRAIVFREQLDMGPDLAPIIDTFYKYPIRNRQYVLGVAGLEIPGLEAKKLALGEGVIVE